MIKKLLLSVFLFAFIIPLMSQGEADKWHFGTNATLNFTGGGTPVAGGATGLSTPEGCSSVSNAAGNLLFYTDGVSVWNNTHALMPNGTGLTGDGSSSQSALIVPSPLANSQYYIFTTAADGGAAGFRYSIVDMALDGGLGDVNASKNVFLTDSTTEKVAAIKDVGGDSYWIVMHKWGTNQFYAYNLTPAGLQPPVMSNAGMVHTTSTFQNTYGQMKFNMCGTKLALAIGYQDTYEVFDFNQATGVISNPLTLPMGGHVYGVEFSKSSDLLYGTCYDPSVKLVQFNISLATLPMIMASKTPLSITDDLYGIQIGPDGKIYVARSFGTSFLGVIDSPETPGSGCNYSDFGIDLDPGFMGVNAALTLPGFMQSYLKIGVICPPTTGITENAFTDAAIFPNPSADEFTIDLTNINESIEITVYDYTGKLVEMQNTFTSAFHFGKTYAKGIYFVNVTTGNELKVYKVVKI